MLSNPTRYGLIACRYLVWGWHNNVWLNAPEIAARYHMNVRALAGVATVGDGRHPALTMRRNKTGLHAQPCTGGGDDVGGGACVGRQLPHGLLSHGSPLRPVLVRDRQQSGLRSVPGYARRASVAAVKRFARRPRRHGRIFGGGKTLQTNKIINQPKNTGRWTHEN